MKILATLAVTALLVLSPVAAQGYVAPPKPSTSAPTAFKDTCGHGITKTVRIYRHGRLVKFSTKRTICTIHPSPTYLRMSF